MSVAGRTEVKPNIWGGKWSKLTLNSMSMALSGILDISDWEISQKPDLLDLCVMLGRECLQVGGACGYQMEPIIGMTAEEMAGAADDAIKRALLTLFSHIGQTSINALLQDLRKGRPTEVRHLNGLVAAKGRAAGIATPLNDEIVRLVEDIEAGRRNYGRENLEYLEGLVEARRGSAHDGLRRDFSVIARPRQRPKQSRTLMRRFECTRPLDCFVGFASSQ